jgi:hypothetical protein
MQNLIRVSKWQDSSLVAKSTLYKMHHLRRYPGLFIKLGGALFVDLDYLSRILEAGRSN